MIITDKKLEALLARLALSHKETERLLQESIKESINERRKWRQESERRHQEIERQLASIGISLGDSDEEFFVKDPVPRAQGVLSH